MPTELRIGLTSRVARAERHDELRDALAADWGKFLTAVLPEAHWQALPNTGAAIAGHLKGWNINSLILTGGNDIGEYAHKDATDLTALDYALAQRIPVFAVCRGLQVLQHYFGGEVVRLPNHAGTTHPVTLTDASPVAAPSQDITVNSYHQFGILEPARELQPFALHNDGSVEGARLLKHKGIGVMWHPERYESARPYDAALLRECFAL